MRHERSGMMTSIKNGINTFLSNHDVYDFDIDEFSLFNHDLVVMSIRIIESNFIINQECQFIEDLYYINIDGFNASEEKINLEKNFYQGSTINNILEISSFLKNYFNLNYNSVFSSIQFIIPINKGSCLGRKEYEISKKLKNI